MPELTRLVSISKPLGPLLQSSYNHIEQLIGTVGQMRLNSTQMKQILEDMLEGKKTVNENLSAFINLLEMNDQQLNKIVEHLATQTERVETIVNETKFIKEQLKSVEQTMQRQETKTAEKDLKTQSKLDLVLERMDQLRERDKQKDTLITNLIVALQDQDVKQRETEKQLEAERVKVSEAEQQKEYSFMVDGGANRAYVRDNTRYGHQREFGYMSRIEYENRMLQRELEMLEFQDKQKQKEKEKEIQKINHIEQTDRELENGVHHQNKLMDLLRTFQEFKQ